jgi:hypothetical protein
MSSGPSILRLNPLSDWSNCIEEEPRSNKAPSRESNETSFAASKAGNSENLPSKGVI